MNYKNNKVFFNDLSSSAFIIILLVSLAQFTQLFSRVDHLIYDIGQRLITTPAPKDVVIIAIDEMSLSQIGRWPWSRQVHADLINQLIPEKPVAIGFDVIFSELDQQNISADLSLVEAVKQSQKVVMPVLMESTRNNGQLIETLPFPDLMDAAADVGRVHAVLDEDSIARSVYLHEGLNTPAWQTFAQAVLNVAYQLPSKNQFEHQSILSPTIFTLAREGRSGIDFLGPPGHFFSISYAQVLKGEFEKGTFNNKIVLIGATALGMSDMLSTPVSGNGLPMPGVEFHANVLESIRSNSLIKEVPFYISFLTVILLSLLPLIWMPKLLPRYGFVLTFLYTAVLVLIAGASPKLLGLWLPPSAALFALTLAYPIWSWRKLEAAQKYLDYELHYLKNNLVDNKMQQKDRYQNNQYDRFDARIAQVRAAANQLRQFQDDKKETLAFISHDIRAPLQAAISILKENSHADHRLKLFLSQAHHLAESFLQASRAEMLEQHNFQEIDVVNLSHQAIDAAFDAALAKKLKLVREVYEGNIWVNGNFGLLERAMLNLILNAIKFSPENSQVVITSHLSDANDWIFSVTDYGPGIAQKEQSQLFKRFSRLEGQANTEGSGLGLYFVKTVAEKHGGLALVNSVAGEFTTFELQLPVVASQPYQPDDSF